jgi:peptide deformylase
MSLKDILIYPEKRLRKKSQTVEKIDKKIQKLLDDLTDTMYNAPGVGLAAPQIGENVRVLVVDISTKEEENTLLELINPAITDSSGTQKSEEGCLSVPGFYGNITRKKKITVEAVNRDDEKFKIEAEDILARVLQHEIDHLDGILFFDKMAKLKKELFIKKIDKTFR